MFEELPFYSNFFRKTKRDWYTPVVHVLFTCSSCDIPLFFLSSSSCLCIVKVPTYSIGKKGIVVLVVVGEGVKPIWGHASTSSPSCHLVVVYPWHTPLLVWCHWLRLLLRGCWTSNERPKGDLLWKVKAFSNATKQQLLHTIIVVWLDIFPQFSHHSNALWDKISRIVLTWKIIPYFHYKYKWFTLDTMGQLIWIWLTLSPDVNTWI